MEDRRGRALRDLLIRVCTGSVSECHLVIQGQVAEGRDVFGPLHQDEQLLFHGLTDVCDGGDLLGPDIAVQYGHRRRDLHGGTQL